MTIEAIELAIQVDIEIVSIPPYNTHRLQQLDTNVNKVIKQLWSEALSKYLADSDDVSLPEIVKKKKKKKKKRINCRSFSHCGLYPLRNTVKAVE